jgi:membrane protease YdiL (CAAX protease family)
VPFATLAAVAVGVVLLSGVVVGIVVGIRGGSAADAPEGLVIGLTVLQDLILVGAAVYATQLVLKRVDPRMFGLRPANVGSAIQWLVVVYAVYWAASFVVLGIFGKPPEQQIVQDLKNTESLSVVLGLGILTCGVAPLAEEFFFRGFMFNALAGRLGVPGAAVITGLVFGAIHITGSSWIGVVVLAVFGMGLCLLFARTGSLLPCIALHALNNSISFGVTKSLPAWGLVALVVVSVGGTVASGAAFGRVRPSSRAAA